MECISWFWNVFYWWEIDSEFMLSTLCCVRNSTIHQRYSSNSFCVHVRLPTSCNTPTSSKFRQICRDEILKVVGRLLLRPQHLFYIAWCWSKCWKIREIEAICMSLRSDMLIPLNNMWCTPHGHIDTCWAAQQSTGMGLIQYYSESVWYSRGGAVTVARSAKVNNVCVQTMANLPLHSLTPLGKHLLYSTCVASKTNGL